MEDTLKQVVAELQNLNQRFDKVDQRFDKVDQRFDKVDQQFDKVDQQFDKVEQQFDKVDQRFDKVDDRFGKVDQRLDHLEDDVKHLKVGQDDLKIMYSATREAIEKAHAELVAFRGETNERFEHLDRQNQFFDSELKDITLELASQNREIKKLKFERNQV